MRGAHVIHPLLHEHWWLVEQYIGLGRSQRAIAREVGCSQPAVRRALERHGIPTRNAPNAAGRVDGRSRMADVARRQDDDGHVFGLGEPYVRLREELQRLRDRGCTFQRAWPVAVNRALADLNPRAAAFWRRVWNREQRAVWARNFEAGADSAFSRLMSLPPGLSPDVLDDADTDDVRGAVLVA